MHRILLHRQPPSAAQLRRLSLSNRQLPAVPLHNTGSALPTFTARPLHYRPSNVAAFHQPLLLTGASLARSYATIQLGATSPQDVGQLLAAASAGEVDKMREVLERKTCTVNDGDYDRRKVSCADTLPPPHNHTRTLACSVGC